MIRIAAVLSLVAFLGCTNQNSITSTKKPKFRWNPDKGKNEDKALVPPEYDFHATSSTADVPKRWFKVVGAKTKRIKLESGTVIEIPKDAFVDADGNPIPGEVNLSFRELYSPSHIMTSGIPMSINSRFEQGHFRSAGMFEIDAKANGASVFVAKGKEINVEFASYTDDKAYSNYYLQPGNKGAEKWVKMGESKIIPNKKADRIEEAKAKADEPGQLFQLNFDTEKKPELKSVANRWYEYSGTELDHRNPFKSSDNVLTTKWTNFKVSNIDTSMTYLTKGINSGQLNKATFSNTGRYLAADVSYNPDETRKTYTATHRKVMLVDLYTGQIKEFKLDIGYNYSRSNSDINFSPDDQHIVMSDAKRHLYYMDVAGTDSKVNKVKYASPLYDTRNDKYGFTPDGEELVTLNSSTTLGYNRIHFGTKKSKTIRSGMKNGKFSGNKQMLVTRHMDYKAVDEEGKEKQFDEHFEFRDSYGNVRLEFGFEKDGDKRMFNDQWFPSYDGKVLVYLENNKMKFRRADGTFMREVESPTASGLRTGIFRPTPDGKAIIRFKGRRGVDPIQIYDFEGNLLLSYQKTTKQNYYSKNNNTIAVMPGTYDHYLKMEGKNNPSDRIQVLTVHDATGVEVLRIKPNSKIQLPTNGKVFSNDNKYVVLMVDNKLALYDIKKGLLKENTVIQVKMDNQTNWKDIPVRFRGDSKQEVLADYNKHVKAEAQREVERIEAEANWRRAFSVTQMGVYNVDKVQSFAPLVTKNATFKLDGRKLGNSRTAYHITGEDGKVVVKHKVSSLASLKFNESWPNAFVVVLSGNKVALVDANGFKDQSSGKSSLSINMVEEAMPQTEEGFDDLLSRIVKQN